MEQIDYKKKYEEAMFRMNKWVEGSEIVDPKEVAEFVFPELKESEDEVMKGKLREILRLCYVGSNCLICTSDYKKLLAWLEKQCEQKVVDNVEPKFKVGDYIINKHGFVMQIDGIDSNTYIYHVLDNSNEKLTYDITKTDKSCHLWTIQDAKDGDVLVYKDEIFVAKHFANLLLVYYCCYNGNVITNSFYSLTTDDINNIHPATKEQCKLLFQKIKEAGYEWDAENKEFFLI